MADHLITRYRSLNPGEDSLGLGLGLDRDFDFDFDFEDHVEILVPPFSQPHRGYRSVPPGRPRMETRLALGRREESAT